MRNGRGYLGLKLVGSVVAAMVFSIVLPGCSQSDDNNNKSTTTTTSAAPSALSTSAPSWVLDWNKIAIDVSGLDHTPAAAGETRVAAENMGPGRSSRAMAIVHIAMFEAALAIHGGYKSYVGLARETSGASTRAAIGCAAYETLIALFPAQKTALQARHDAWQDGEKDSDSRKKGLELGKRAAKAILDLRKDDGSLHVEPRVGTDYEVSDLPGRWRPDPITGLTVALGAKWSVVKPFVMTSASQFRCPAPPALDSAEYTSAYKEVQRLGGDGIVTPTERTLLQSIIGIYWGYDGTPTLCAPPRLYNQIATLIAVQKGTGALELLRLLALVNVAMADAGIGSWESKYHYDVWRPISAIRESDAGTGPSGAGDDNDDTVGDPTFTPLGAPASNRNSPNFTPPFPAYPSGHATFGGALFQVLRNFYGTDEIPFTFVSDEFDGKTLDRTGQVRPLIPRSFKTFTEAEEENGQSRIFLGIHFKFDKTAGIKQGRQIADLVTGMIYLPSGK